VKRSKRPEYVVGLDVGTTKICAVIAEPRAGGGLDVVGVGAAPSRGLRRGVVVNIDSTVEAIKLAVAEAEQMAGAEVSRVYAGVAGGHIRSVNSRGVVAISGKEREVSAVDVERAIDAARAINVPQDREIIHVLPQAYMIDDADGVREPLGMSGVRLEVECHIVTGAITAVQNVIRSVNRAGLTVQDVVLEPIASAEAVLFLDEKELGVVVIDIGGGTTDLALVRDGAIWHTAILPLGGDHITNDVAVGLRTPMADAEDLKKRYGCALTSLVAAEETVDVPSVGGRKPRQLSRQVLSEIIQPRVEEIFTLVARDLAKAGFQDAVPAGIVVTGGTSIMEGVPEIAESVFDLPVRRGAPGDRLSGRVERPDTKAAGRAPARTTNLADVVKSPVYATAVGLALYGARRQAPGPSLSEPYAGGALGRWGRRLAGWFGEIF
jgi:cell division protein FtsA